MNWTKNQKEEPRENINQIQTKINVRTDRTVNYVVPQRKQDSDSDELELSDDDSEKEVREKVKYSDELYKMVPKIIYKEVLLDSKKADYDMFSYQVKPKSTGGEKEKAFVLSRTELKKAEIPVDSKPIRVYDKLIYMSKAV